MNKIKWGAVIVSAAFVAACSKDDSKNNAAVNEGLCTSATVDAYNAIGTAARSSSRNATMSEVQGIKNACVNYKNLIAGNSCKAAVDGVETMVSATSRDPICNAADSVLLQMQQQSQQSSSQAQCPYAAAQSFQTIIGMASKIDAGTSIEDLSKMQAACGDFRNSMTMESCSMADFSGGSSSLLINRSSTTDVCAKIDNVIRIKKDSLGLNAGQATTADDQKSLLSITGFIGIKVIDQVLFEKSSNGTLVFQNGKLVDMTKSFGDDSFDFGLPFCSIIAKSLKPGQNLFIMPGFKLSAKQQYIQSASNSTTDPGEIALQISCMDAYEGNAKDMSLLTLKTIFKSVLEIKPL